MSGKSDSNSEDESSCGKISNQTPGQQSPKANNSYKLVDSGYKAQKFEDQLKNEKAGKEKRQTYKTENPESSQRIAEEGKKSTQTRRSQRLASRKQ